MHIVLSDPMITVDGWTPELDKLGQYTQKVRKTPAELKAEREHYAKLYGASTKRKPVPFKVKNESVITKSEKFPGVAYFSPGLWPRVKAYLDSHSYEYTLEDKRNMEIRPALDLKALEGASFRTNQDVALALIATSDCGIIETSTAWGKCESADTKILMYDGSIKKVQDVVVGDLVMGPDSTPRKVLRTTTGFGPMYKYTPIKGDVQHFTEHHTLTLVVCVAKGMRYKGRKYNQGDLLDIQISDYIKQSTTFKHKLKAIRTAIDFPERKQPELDPYFVGLYLGDGDSLMLHERMPRITNPDKEIQDYCIEYGTRMGWSPSFVPSRSKNCPTLSFHKTEHAIHRNTCTKTEKRIMPDYKYGSRTTRLAVLAGLLDTDGYAYGSIYEICTKYDGLAEDILFVARSLGLSANDNYCEKVCTNTGKSGMYHRIKISGDCSGLPIRIPRKKVEPRKQSKDVLHVGFTLTRDEDNTYYGFELDQDNRFVLGDFTITHNSYLISMICKAYPTLNILVCTSSTTVVSTLYEYLCSQIPGQVGMLGGGRCTTQGKRVIVSTLKSMSKIDPKEVHLVLVDECHSIGNNLAGKDLLQFCFARKFGFSASPIRNDGSQLMLEALLGPTILKMTYDEAVDAGMVTPMKYCMLHCNSCPSICHNQDIPEVLMKRYAYWRNTARNKAIQQFVHKLKQVYDGQVLIMVGERFVVPVGF